MKIKPFFFSLFVSCIWLTLEGCAQSSSKIPSAAPASTDNAIFYLYRPEATSPGLMKPLKFDYPDVLVDGRSIGVLKYDEYLVAELSPGAHAINITGLTTAAKGWETRDIERSIKADKNQKIFMKLRVEYDVNKMHVGQPGAKYLIDLIPVDEKNAKYEIRKTGPAK